MKVNFFKILFILFIICIIAIAIYNSIPKEKKTDVIASQISLDKNAVISNNLRIGIIEFDNFNPLLSNNKNVQDISRLIFEPLFTLTEDYKLEGALAKEYSKTGEMSYIVKLCENIKWQDGNKFDVSDVIFTIDMLKKLGTESVYYYNVKDISGLEEIDEYTLKINVNEEMNYFEYNLIFPIISSKYYNEENFKHESKNMNPPGTGIFYISETNNNSILLKKSNIKSNSKMIQLDTITLNLYNSLTNTITAYKAGEIDMFITANINIDEYIKNTNYNKQEYINRNYDYIILNCKNNVLANKEVRQAINSAIDKEEIVREIYNNQYRIANFPLDFGSFVYNTSNTVIAHDKSVAKGLLVDNGWKYSSNRWKKNIDYKYLSIELRLLVNKSNSKLTKVAKNIKEQLEKIGIKINIIEASEDEYNKYIKNEKYDLILASGSYGYSPSLNKYFRTDNLANYTNEEIIDILNEVQNITDEDQLKQRYSRIMEIYNEDVPYISLYYDTSTIIYSSSLKGTINPNSYNLFYGIDSWYRLYTK